MILILKLESNYRSELRRCYGTKKTVSSRYWGNWEGVSAPAIVGYVHTDSGGYSNMRFRAQRFDYCCFPADIESAARRRGGSL
jgi:hypothetical protein